MAGVSFDGGMGSLYGSLVLDITTKKWQFWSCGTMPTSVICFPFQSATLANGSTATSPKTLLLSEDGTTIFRISEQFANDQVGVTGYPINAYAQTKIQDAGNNRTKFWGRLDLICDQAFGAPDAATSILISVSDDDYQTGSTPRRFDLSSIRPTLFRWGSSRKRAIGLNWVTPLTCRVRYLEQEYDQGS
jgi:hypothetical protein